jgi:hypothetical protein
MRTTEEPMTVLDVWERQRREEHAMRAEATKTAQPVDAKIFLFPSVKRTATIRKWAEELYGHRDKARQNLMRHRLRLNLESRLRQGIDEKLAREDVDALARAVWHLLAILDVSATENDTA